MNEQQQQNIVNIKKARVNMTSLMVINGEWS